MLRRNPNSVSQLFLIGFFFLSFISVRAQFSQLDPASAVSIDQAVNFFMGDHQIIGSTVCIIKNGKIVYLKGYGYQDLDNQIPATEYTMYRTGSVAKSFTAVIALQLWEENILDILTDVRQYVPEWPVKPQGTITPYRLMAHRSGINHYQEFDTLLMINYDSTFHDFDAIAAIDIFKDADLLFTPGSQFGYSTFGFNLLGAVTERAENIPFEDQLKNRITTPFHLPYLQPEYCWKRPYPQETRGYHFDGGFLVETGDDIGILYKLPGGGLICTAVDLAVFSIAMMENQLYQDTTLFQWAADPAHSGASFGLGIMNDYASKHYLWHGGGQQRTNSLFMFYPDDKNGVVICSNTFLQGFPLQSLGEILLDMIPSFTVTGPDWQPIPDTMPEPVLIYPPQYDFITTSGDSLIWSSVEHAYTYIYEYATNPTFQSSVCDTIYDTSIFINYFQPGQTYYWRVRGLNTYLYDTVMGNWSNTGIFTTDTSAVLSSFQNDQFRIYPSPTQGLIRIEGLNDACDVQVLDILGQNVSFMRDEQSIDLSHLPKGIYFVYIITEKYTISKKIILY